MNELVLGLGLGGFFFNLAIQTPKFVIKNSYYTIEVSYTYVLKKIYFKHGEHGSFGCNYFCNLWWTGTSSFTTASPHITQFSVSLSAKPWIVEIS